QGPDADRVVAEVKRRAQLWDRRGRLAGIAQPPLHVIDGSTQGLSANCAALPAMGRRADPCVTPLDFVQSTHLYGSHTIACGDYANQEPHPRHQAFHTRTGGWSQADGSVLRHLEPP